MIASNGNIRQWLESLEYSSFRPFTSPTLVNASLTSMARFPGSRETTFRTAVDEYLTFIILFRLFREIYHNRIPTVLYSWAAKSLGRPEHVKMHKGQEHLRQGAGVIFVILRTIHKILVNQVPLNPDTFSQSNPTKSSSLPIMKILFNNSSS